MVHLQGRVALAAVTAAKADRDRSRSIKSATQQAQRIEKANVPWAIPLAKLIRAGIANLNGQTAEALQLLTEAEGGSRALHVSAYTAAFKACSRTKHDSHAQFLLEQLWERGCERDASAEIGMDSSRPKTRLVCMGWDPGSTG